MINTTYLDICQRQASNLFSAIKDVRRHLHTYPELSFEELNTSNYIASILDEYNIPYTRGWAGHGIVATIEGQTSDSIALRADIDALPIHEANDVPYASVNKGIMHACGHDVHSSCLLGAAIILHNNKKLLSHSIKIIFQPGEEKLPGGAGMMIEEGLFEESKPHYILGQHVQPSIEVGKVGIKEGLYMASADEIYISVKGRGGHAAMPHECNDTVLASSHLVVSLQQIISRLNDARIPSVLSIGKFNTQGGATNVLPAEVKLEGTFRTFDEIWRFKAHEHIQQVARSVATMFDVHVEVDIRIGYPFLHNDVYLTQQIKQGLISYVGDNRVEDLDIRMTSEDFAYYTHHVPGCFYRLGTGNVSKGITAPLHHPNFDIDESALELGMGLMAYLALNKIAYPTD